MATPVHRSVPSPRLPNRRNPAAKVARAAAAAPAAAVLVLVEMVLVLVEMVLVLAAAVLVLVEADRKRVARVVVVDQVEADLEVAEDRAGVARVEVVDQVETDLEVAEDRAGVVAAVALAAAAVNYPIPTVARSATAVCHLPTLAVPVQVALLAARELLTEST